MFVVASHVIGRVYLSHTLYIAVFALCFGASFIYLYINIMHLLKEITSQHLFPYKNAYIFGQDLVLSVQESSSLSLLQHIPKT